MTTVSRLQTLIRLDTWRSLGATPDVAAIGCFVASTLVAPEKTYARIGENRLADDFHADVADRLSKCEKLSDFQSFFAKNFEILSAMTGDIEAQVGTKQISVYCPTPQQASSVLGQVAFIEDWGEAAAYVADRIKPPVPFKGSGITAAALCEKFGLSSLAIGPAGDAQALLDRLDSSLTRVAARMNLTDLADLGGRGRLCLHASLPASAAPSLMGECRMFANESALISLSADYHEGTLDHELLHFYDGLASFACDPARKEGCLSNRLAELRHPIVKQIEGLLARHIEKHAELFEDLESLDIDVNGARYWTKHAEVLARAFDEKLSVPMEEIHSLLEPSFVDDQKKLVKEFLEIIRPAVGKYLDENPLPWIANEKSVSPSSNSNRTIRSCVQQLVSPAAPSLGTGSLGGGIFQAPPAERGAVLAKSMRM